MKVQRKKIEDKKARVEKKEKKGKGKEMDKGWRQKKDTVFSLFPPLAF